MKKFALVFVAFVFLFLKGYSQNQPQIFEQFRSIPNPFDKSRISWYINAEELSPFDYEGFYRRGIRNLQNGLFQEAIENFRRVLIPVSDMVGVRNSFPEPWFFMGVCKNYLNEPDSAMYYFDMTLKIDPAHADAYNERGILHLDQWNYKAALSDFHSAHQFDPNLMYAYYNIGYTYFLAGEEKMASKILKKVAKSAPDYNWPHILMGIMDMNNHKLSRAEKRFTTAIEINPAEPVAYYNRGLARAKQGWIEYSLTKFSSAYSDFKRVTELNPTDAQAYDMLIFIDILQKKPENALRNKQTAVNILFQNPDYRNSATPYQVEEYYLLSEIATGRNVSNKEMNIARDYFIANYSIGVEASASKIKTELLKNPSSLFLKRLLIFHFMKEMNTDDMATFLDEVLPTDNTLTHLQSLRGELFQIENKTSEGLRLMRKSLETDSTYAFSYYVTGKLLYDKENYQEAIKMFDKAIEIKPAFVSAFNYRSRTFLAIDEYKKALDDSYMMTFLNPDSHLGYYLAGLVYNKMNEPDSALMMLDAASYLEPMSIFVHNEKAYSYKLLDNPKKIDETFDNLIYIYRKSGLGWYYKGLFYNDKVQDTLTGISCLQIAVSADPQNKFFIAAIGDFNYGKRQDYRAAIKDYKKAIGVDPEYIYALSMTGRAYYNLEEYISAIHFFEKVLKVDSLNVGAINNIGSAYRRLDNNSRALQFFLKAEQIDPANDFAVGSAGWCYYLLDDFENCIGYSKRAIELKSDSYYAMANIALSTLRLGRYDESLELYTDYWEKVKDLEESVYEGAITDLEDLIEKGILVNEARYILKTYFGME